LHQSNQRLSLQRINYGSEADSLRQEACQKISELRSNDEQRFPPENSADGKTKIEKRGPPKKSRKTGE
jgi:hypothetical protein